MIEASNTFRAPVSSPALEAVPGLDESRGLAAERHRALGAAPHFLDEVAAAGAAENRQRAARRGRHVRDLGGDRQGLDLDVGDVPAVVGQPQRQPGRHGRLRDVLQDDRDADTGVDGAVVVGDLLASSPA